MGYWFCDNKAGEGPVISTRVRLARNLKSIPFPSRMTDDQKNEVNEKIKTVVKESDSPVFKGLKFIMLKDIPENERFSMVERHIISREFAENVGKKAILISEDENICIMIGEEDHIRIQVIKSGFDAEKAYEIANEIDEELCRNLQIAYDNDLGFLTECPTNLGTGLRVSVMIHLPLLSMSGEMPYLCESINKVGFTVRGMYGEGSKATSAIYQISNQITLGISEKNAIDNLKIIVDQLSIKETEKTEKIDKIVLEDRCMRALYTLMGAKIISSNEMMSLISDVMIGIRAKIIDDSKINPIKVLIDGQPFMLMSKYGDKTSSERDILRASLIKENLN